MENNNEDFNFMRIANMPGEKLDVQEFEYLEMRAEAAKKSMEKRKKRLEKKKIITSLILSLSITALIIIGGAIYYNNRSITIPDGPNTFVPITKEDKSYVINRIEEYKELMNMYSDKENRIEIEKGFNVDRYEITVDYDYNNLKKHIVNAAKISEEETRIVIRAAYDIINIPYRTETLDRVLKNIEDDEIDPKLKDIISHSAEYYFKSLGYKDKDEYAKYEVENIIRLHAIGSYMKGEEEHRNGKNTM